MLKLLLSVGALFILASCTIVSPPSPRTIYSLAIPSAIPSVTKPKTACKRTLILKKITAAPHLGSTHIFFRRDENTVDYFKFSFWVETPPNALAEALIPALDNALHQTVVPAGSGVPGNSSLTVHLAEFIADFTASPARAYLTTRIFYHSPENLEAPVQTAQFTTEANLSNEDANGAAKALKSCLEQAVTKITAWVATLAPQDCQ